MLERLDQAQGLRRLFSRPAVRVLPLLAADDESFAPFAGALAGALARIGRRPVLLDADRGRIAPALGLRARYDLLHVMAGDCEIAAALCPDARGFALLPAARGLDALGGRDDAAKLFTAFGRLRPAFDTALVAAPAGRLVQTLGAAFEPLVFATTDTAGVQSAWRRIAALRDRHGPARVRVAWCLTGDQSAASAHARLAETLAHHAGVQACDAGSVASLRDAGAIQRVAMCALETALPEFGARPGDVPRAAAARMPAPAPEPAMTPR